MNINEWLRNHRVDCSRGAPLGDSGQEGRKDYPYTFYLQRIKMIDHDYDSAGTYWGMGREPTDTLMGRLQEIKALINMINLEEPQ